jgi:DNA-binding IclR family transcriptional regulator
MKREIVPIPHVVEAKTDSGTLQRGFAILELLNEATRPLTSREIADAIQVNDSTVHRLLKTMRELGYVCRDEAKRYHASPKSFLPLTIYHPLNLLRRETFEPLRALREQFGLTASFIVFVGSERLVLDVSGVTGMLTPYYDTYLRSPIHASASGKLLLQSLSPKVRAELLGAAPFRAFTPKTITDPDALSRELDETARRGYAVNLDENFVGISAMGALIICGPGQAAGCLLLAGASDRFNEQRIDEIGQALREKADLFSFGSPPLRAVKSMFSRFG